VIDLRGAPTSVPFLTSSGWGLWSPAEYEASVDGTAVSVRCTDGGIEFGDGISPIAGQTLTLTSCTPRVVLTTG
jgi:hypothetical protein